MKQVSTIPILSCTQHKKNTHYFPYMKNETTQSDFNRISHRTRDNINMRYAVYIYTIL